MGILYIEGLSEPEAPAPHDQSAPHNNHEALEAIQDGLKQAFGDNVSFKNITTDGLDAIKKVQHFIMQINIKGLSNEKMMEQSTKLQINKLLTRVKNNNQYLTTIELIESTPALNRVFLNKELFSDDNLKKTSDQQSKMKNEFNTLRSGSPATVTDNLSHNSHSDEEDTGQDNRFS